MADEARALGSPIEDVAKWGTDQVLDLVSTSLDALIQLLRSGNKLATGIETAGGKSLDTLIEELQKVKDELVDEDVRDVCDKIVEILP